MIQPNDIINEAARLEAQFNEMPLPDIEPTNKKWDLSQFCVEIDNEIPEPEPLLNIGTQLVLSRGNISTIKGKAKARKSFFIALLIKMMLDQNPDLNMLLIDSEQSKSFVFKALNRIYRLMGWTNKDNRLKVLSLRECDVIDRKSILIQAVDELKADVVLLDGGVDIITDFNNPQESKEVTGLLMKLSTDYNCHIINVLHEGKTNGELRGHYGAEMLNKSETVFEVVKDGDQSVVKPYATRNQSFDEFFFTIDEMGLPRYGGAVEQKKSKADVFVDNMKMRFIRLLAPNKILDYQTIANEYTELAGCSERTSKNHISKMVLMNFIRKTTDPTGYCLSNINEVLS